MKRTLLQQWIHVGWHLDGMSWDRYLALTMHERWVLHDELTEFIERSNDEGGGTRSKELRRM